MKDANEIRNTLPHFTGTSVWYKHACVPGVTYTEGAKYLFESADAYWLLDKIATCGTMLPECKPEEFQVWKLKVADNKATLSCEDGNGNTVYTENLQFTDFPLSEAELWLTNNVILLPSEY